MDLRLTLAVVCWSLLVVLALIPLFKGSFTEGSRWRVTMGLFALLLGCSLVTWRWRSLTYDGEINVDESQLLSQAMRFMLDPLPWRSVDGGSSGPLNTWVLMWAPLLGLKFSYLTARITSLFCVWNIFVAMGLAISEIAGRRIALALVLPSATFILTTTNFDFVFLSSEQLPSAISAWAIYLITLQIKTPRRWVAYLIGFLLGALPFCKIQVGPAGVFLFAGSTCVWLARLGRSKEAWRGILIQCAGGLTVPFLILGPVMMCGAGTEFYEFYIRTALSYRNSGNMMQKMDVQSLVFAVKEFGVLTVSVLTLAVVGTVWRCVERRRGSNDPFYWGMLVFAAAYVLLTAGSILRTGYPFPHYLMLLIVPGLAMLGTAFSGSFGTSKGGLVEKGRQTSDVSWFAARGLAVSGVAVVVALAVQASAAIGDISKNSRLMGDWGSGIHPIAGVIRGQLKPGDTVAVWGWAPKFNVMSEAPPAFRFSQSLFLLDESPWFAEVRPFFLTRFMADLEKSRPRLFIDAPDEFMWPGYPQGTMARHWVIPVLSEFIRKNYSLIGTMPSPPGKAAIMVYRLKEA